MITYSFIIPAHNEEKHLEECIDSILSNMTNINHSRYEILVIADSCTDKTESITRRYTEINHKIKLFSCDFKNVSFTRNYGAENAIGDYFFFVDGDTLLNVNLFKDIIERNLEKYDGNVVISTHYSSKNEDGCNRYYGETMKYIINKYLDYTNTGIGPFIGVTSDVAKKVKFGTIISEDIIFIQEAKKLMPLYIVPRNYVLTDSLVCNKDVYDFITTYVTSNNIKQLYSPNLIILVAIVIIIAFIVVSFQRNIKLIL